MHGISLGVEIIASMIKVFEFEIACYAARYESAVLI